jgi:ribosome recycling factor
MSEAKDKMDRTVQMLSEQLVGIRTSGGVYGFVQSVKIPYYGSQTPLEQVSSLTSQGNRLAIKPYDLSIVDAIETALKASGLNAYKFSKDTVVVTEEAMSGEKREMLQDHVRKLGEEAKVAIRAIRKNHRPDKLSGSEDEVKTADKKLQEATDSSVAKIDAMVKTKCSDL